MRRKLLPFSEQVRSAIDSVGLSRADICKAIDLDESAMSRFMVGERGLSLAVLDRLGLLLGLTLRPVKVAKRRKGS